MPPLVALVTERVEGRPAGRAVGMYEVDFLSGSRRRAFWWRLSNHRRLY